MCHRAPAVATLERNFALMSLNRTARSTAIATCLIGATLALGACGATSSTTSEAPKAAASSAAASASAAASSAAAPVSSAATAAASSAAAATTPKVNANTASKADISAALTKAGVKNADKWANEIEEYRPYTATTLTTKLKGELGKYGVDQETLAKIMSVLTI